MVWTRQKHSNNNKVVALPVRTSGSRHAGQAAPPHENIQLFESTADELFEKYYPDYSDKVYRTKSGKEIDVSGDHFKNKLSAIIEYLENKSEKKTLVGSNIIYLLDWIDNINELQCKGVHHEISRSDAERCIIQTYICLGDILNMQSE